MVDFNKINNLITITRDNLKVTAEDKGQVAEARCNPVDDFDFAFGAFSFITHNSEPWTINVGIPSVKIKNRNKNIIKLEQMYMSDLRKLSFSCGGG